MPTTLAPAPTRSSIELSTVARRSGYVAAIIVNAVLLWITHRLLVWEWPGFLTEEFGQVLGLVSVSFIVGMIVNAGFLIQYRGGFRAFGDLLTAAVSLAVGLRMWSVFPFDFTGYATDWTWLVRLALVVGIVATGIAVFVNVVKLAIAASPTTQDGRPHLPPRVEVPSRDADASVASGSGGALAGGRELPR